MSIDTLSAKVFDQATADGLPLSAHGGDCGGGQDVDSQPPQPPAGTACDTKPTRSAAAASPSGRHFFELQDTAGPDAPTSFFYDASIPRGEHADSFQLWRSGSGDLFDFPDLPKHTEDPMPTTSWYETAFACNILYWRAL
eukprot:CAMPEP_0177635328 /NCGR_PEP_ID=MMETSP0447-20121125/3843_1 /TAXON_ID=0 /ORGANISM="Stygamoeba regulata, Strain BSH-02190019" /LENGTH=139 /DNA_ID=CAMNT_0019137109 /DNA_START=144 /DNA_END=563 /DNA_ORIENTATION=+